MAVHLSPLPALPKAAETAIVALTPEERHEIRELIIEFAGRLEREGKKRYRDRDTGGSPRT